MKPPAKTVIDTHLVAMMAATIASNARYTLNTTPQEIASSSIKTAEAILMELRCRGYPRPSGPPAEPTEPTEES